MTLFILLQKTLDVKHFIEKIARSTLLKKSQGGVGQKSNEGVKKSAIL